MKIKRFIFLLEWKQWKNCWIVDCCLLHKEMKHFFNCGVVGYMFCPQPSTQSILSICFHSLIQSTLINLTFFTQQTHKPNNFSKTRREWVCFFIELMNSEMKERVDLSCSGVKPITNCSQPLMKSMSEEPGNHSINSHFISPKQKKLNFFSFCSWNSILIELKWTKRIL